MGQLRDCRRTRARVVTLAVFILASCLPSSIAHPADAAQRPSLDRLCQRVADYWHTLQRREKLKALAFATEGTRETLLARREPAFSEPRVVRLEPAANGQTVTVTIEVKRSIPPLADVVKFPVTEEWVFQNGEWFVRVRASGLPFMTPESGVKGTPPSPEEIERSRKLIQDRLRFEKTEIDFGAIRKGRTASAEIEYQLSGEDALRVKLADTPPGLVVRGLAKGQLLPGGPHKIDFDFLSENYGGKVQENFSVLVQHGDAIVPYRFTVRADVHAPVLAMPPVLRFSVTETEKEFLIRNNSSSDVEIAALPGENSALQVTPLPQTVAAGKEIRLKAKLLNTALKNHREILIFRLSEPVEDMDSVELPVLVNPTEKPAGAPPALNPEQIQKLIPKNRPPG